jgi:hypothetical protein
MHMPKKYYGTVLVAASLAAGLIACGGGADTAGVEPKPAIPATPAAEKVGSPSFNLQDAFKAQILLPAAPANFDVSGTFGNDKITNGSATISSEDYRTGTFPSTTQLAYSKLSSISIVVSFKTESNPPNTIILKSCFNSWFSMDYLPLGQEQQGSKASGVCPVKPLDPTTVSFLPGDEFIVYDGALTFPMIAKGNQSGYIYDSATRFGSSALTPQLGTITKPTWEFIKPLVGSTDAQVILKVKELDQLGKDQLVMTTTYNIDSKNTLSIIKWEYIDGTKRLLLTRKP